MEKETEEDTYLKIVRAITGDEVNFLELCKLYHSERVKQLVPDIHEIYSKTLGLNSQESIRFEQGAKYIIELLTKGEQ